MEKMVELLCANMGEIELENLPALRFTKGLVKFSRQFMLLVLSIQLQLGCFLTVFFLFLLRQG